MASTANSAHPVSDPSITTSPVLDILMDGSDLLSGLRLDPPAASSVDLTNDINITSKTNDEEDSKTGSQQLPAGSPVPIPSQETEYKTSAMHNAPSFLSPNSSAAVLEFLAMTPPSTPPGIQAGSDADKVDGVPPTIHESSDPDTITEPAAPAKPTTLGIRTETETVNLARSTDGPRLDNPSASVEKKPKWKKLFGIRGVTRQKSVETVPEVVVAGRREWFKIDRRKKNKGHSVTAEREQDVNDSSKPAGQKQTSTVETGFMGVGADGVWISGKNFLKS